jgi:hypothetical protein
MHVGLFYDLLHVFRYDADKDARKREENQSVDDGCCCHKSKGRLFVVEVRSVLV